MDWDFYFSNAIINLCRIQKSDLYLKAGNAWNVHLRRFRCFYEKRKQKRFGIYESVCINTCFSNPVEIDGQKYLDGGISDSIPLDFMMKNGFQKNVVILTQEREYRKKESKSSIFLKPFLKKYPKVIEAMKKRP